MLWKLTSHVIDEETASIKYFCMLFINLKEVDLD